MSHYTGLVAQADKALYDAKRAGRDRVAVAADPRRWPARRCSTASPTPYRPRGLTAVRVVEEDGALAESVSTTHVG